MRSSNAVLLLIGAAGSWRKNPLATIVSTVSINIKAQQESQIYWGVGDIVDVRIFVPTYNVDRVRFDNDNWGDHTVPQWMAARKGLEYDFLEDSTDASYPCRADVLLDYGYWECGLSPPKLPSCEWLPIGERMSAPSVFHEAPCYSPSVNVNDVLLAPQLGEDVVCMYVTGADSSDACTLEFPQIASVGSSALT